VATKRDTWPITKGHALAEIRRYGELYPDSPPEVSAMGLMRQVDSWEEYWAILKALDEVLAHELELEYNPLLRSHTAGCSCGWVGQEEKSKLSAMRHFEVHVR
jgi:ABC-type Fe3+ transport system substrate-binding protein